MKPEPTPITGKEDPQGLTLPLRALSQFYAAFNDRDLEKMARNWAPTPDIAMSNPVGGIKRGWEEIRAVYERLLHGRMQVQVQFYDYTLHEAPDIFYAVGRERGESRRGAVVIPLAIRTTRIFRRVEGEWRQVHHHGSFDDPELLRRYQDSLK